jgi:hypothetical protein
MIKNLGYKYCVLIANSLMNCYFNLFYLKSLSETEVCVYLLTLSKLRPARDWEILNCIKLTQHYKIMH